MVFNFSFSTSATIVSTSSINGETKGWAYRHQSYRTPDGSGVRTTRQTLGDAPETETRMYDAQGRPLLTDGHNNNNQGGGSSSGSSSSSRRNNYVSQRGGNNFPVGKIISIEDVTEEENAKAANAQWNNTQQKN